MAGVTQRTGQDELAAVRCLDVRPARRPTGRSARQLLSEAWRGWRAWRRYGGQPPALPSAPSSDCRECFAHSQPRALWSPATPLPSSRAWPRLGERAPLHRVRACVRRLPCTRFDMSCAGPGQSGRGQHAACDRLANRHCEWVRPDHWAFIPPGLNRRTCVGRLGASPGADRVLTPPRPLGRSGSARDTPGVHPCEPPP